MPSPPRRTVNLRGHGSQLREEILDATERLLARSDAQAGVTLRAIAREVGVAAPSIYPHFPDRDAILDTVVARGFEQLTAFCAEAVENVPRGIPEVEALCRAYLQFAAEHRGRYRVLFDRTAANITTPPHRYEEGLRAFGLLVEALQRVADLQSGSWIEPMRDAQSLVVALHGIATLGPALPAFPWIDEDSLLQNLVDKIVAGDGR